MGETTTPPPASPSKVSLMRPALLGLGRPSRSFSVLLMHCNHMGEGVEEALKNTDAWAPPSHPDYWGLGAAWGF